MQPVVGPAACRLRDSHCFRYGGMIIYPRRIIWGKLSHTTTLGTDNTNARAKEERCTL